MNRKILEEIDWKGGEIIYDDFDIDFSMPLNQQEFSLKEDLLQVRYGDYLLDVGWYPEFEFDGALSIRVVHNFNWVNPMFICEARDGESLKNCLQKAISCCLKGV